jgi:hypothetical protein
MKLYSYELKENIRNSAIPRDGTRIQDPLAY